MDTWCVRNSAAAEHETTATSKGVFVCPQIICLKHTARGAATHALLYAIPGHHHRKVHGSSFAQLAGGCNSV